MPSSLQDDNMCLHQLHLLPDLKSSVRIVLDFDIKWEKPTTMQTSTSVGIEVQDLHEFCITNANFAPRRIRNIIVAGIENLTAKGADQTIFVKVPYVQQPKTHQPLSGMIREVGGGSKNHLVVTNYDVVPKGG